MKSKLNIALALVAVSLGGTPALAQDADAEAPEAAQESAPVEADSDAETTGAEATPDPAIAGQQPPAAGDPAAQEMLEVVRGTFGDWEIRCAPEGQDCFMYQLAEDETGNPVAEVSLIALPDEAEAAAGVTVVTPLGTLLPPGLQVQIDSSEPQQFPFAWCSQVGCFSRFPVDQGALDGMKRGSVAKLSLVPVAAPAQLVTLDVSLSGFTAAFENLTSPATPASE